MFGRFGRGFGRGFGKGFGGGQCVVTQLISLGFSQEEALRIVNQYRGFGLRWLLANATSKEEVKKRLEELEKLRQG